MGRQLFFRGLHNGPGPPLCLWVVELPVRRDQEPVRFFLGLKLARNKRGVGRRSRATNLELNRAGESRPRPNPTLRTMNTSLKRKRSPSSLQRPLRLRVRLIFLLFATLIPQAVACAEMCAGRHFSASRSETTVAALSSRPTRGAACRLDRAARCRCGRRIPRSGRASGKA